MAKVLRPVAPIYIKVTPKWLIEVRTRPVEELMKMKWYNFLGVRAFGVTREEFVWCLKDDYCFESLIRGICVAIKIGRVKTRKEYLKSWLTFCVHYW